MPKRGFMCVCREWEKQQLYYWCMEVKDWSVPSKNFPCSSQSAWYENIELGTVFVTKNDALVYLEMLGGIVDEAVDLLVLNIANGVLYDGMGVKQ